MDLPELVVHTPPVKDSGALPRLYMSGEAAIVFCAMKNMPEKGRQAGGLFMSAKETCGEGIMRQRPVCLLGFQINITVTITILTLTLPG